MSVQTKNKNFSAVQLLACTAAGVAGTLLASCLFAFLLVSRSLPQTLLAPFSAAALCIGSFAAAWLLGRLRGENGLLCGAVMFCILFALTCLWAWANGCRTVETAAVVRTVLSLLCSGAGGYAGMYRAEKSARRHR